MMSYLWPNKRPRLLREKLFWWWQQWGEKLFPSFVRIDHSILLLAEYFISDRLNASKITDRWHGIRISLVRMHNIIFYLLCTIWCFGWELEIFLAGIRWQRFFVENRCRSLRRDMYISMAVSIFSGLYYVLKLLKCQISKMVYTRNYIHIQK